MIAFGIFFTDLDIDPDISLKLNFIRSCISTPINFWYNDPSVFGMLLARKRVVLPRRIFWTGSLIFKDP